MEIEKDKDVRELVMLRCVRKHIVMWHKELTPYPDKCPAEIGKDVDFELCRNSLQLQGHVKFYPLKNQPGIVNWFDFIFHSREEAENILNLINTLLKRNQVVLVADFKELAGETPTTVDIKWGWVDLINVKVRKVYSGYLIDFPPPYLI